MKVYVVKYNNFVRTFREELRNTRTQVVHLIDVLTQERIVMSEQFLRSITLKEFEATDESSPLAEHEKECYNEAVDNFNALTDYVWTRTDNLEEVNSALLVIQEAMERIEGEIYNGSNKMVRFICVPSGREGHRHYRRYYTAHPGKNRNRRILAVITYYNRTYTGYAIAYRREYRKSAEFARRERRVQHCRTRCSIGGNRQTQTGEPATGYAGDTLP